MKKPHDVGRLFDWAREQESPVVRPLSENQRIRLLHLWQQQHKTDQGIPALVAILRWAVAGSIGVMIISILLSQRSGPNGKPNPESLGSAFKPENSIVLYVR